MTEPNVAELMAEAYARYNARQPERDAAREQAIARWYEEHPHIMPPDDAAEMAAQLTASANGQMLDIIKDVLQEHGIDTTHPLVAEQFEDLFWKLGQPTTPPKAVTR